MKIVNRKDFLKLPECTLYCKYEAGDNSAPEIKYDTVGANDWVRQDLSFIDAVDCGELSRRLTEMETNGASYPLELDCAGRDGYFDEEQLILIYEQEDIKLLILELQKCLSAEAVI